jgi:hypothetical protein
MGSYAREVLSKNISTLQLFSLKALIAYIAAPPLPIVAMILDLAITNYHRTYYLPNVYL